MSTSLLTNLAAVAVILSKTDQLARVTTFQSEEASPAEREEALTDLLSANVRLAHKVAKQHVRNGLDFQDLLAQACEGIIHAASKFKLDSKASFTTYAKQWMRARCQEHVQAHAGILHCGSRTSKKLWSSLQKARKAIGVDATPEAIAAHLKLDVTDVNACLASMTSRGVSVDRPIGDDEVPKKWFVCVSDGGELRQDTRLERTQNSEAIAKSLAEFAGTLNTRQTAILRGRIINGLLGEDQRCAKTFGVSKQRVGQIEKQLRGKLCAHFTRSFGTEGVKAILHASF